MSTLSLKIIPLIAFLAVAHHVERGDGTRELAIESCFSHAEIDESRYRHYASYKLKNVANQNFMSYYTSQLGSWFVKGYKGVIYIAATSDVYPNDIAIECVDELYETIISAKRSSSWGRSKRRQESMDACCRGLAAKYGTLDEGSAAHAIMTGMADVREPYLDHIKELMAKVDSLQHQMHQNIQNELKNIETAEAIQEKSQECLEMAKIFKKRASKLKWNTWYKDNRGVFVGTTVFSIAGGVGGFLIGGPAGAGVLSGMGSVAAAQAIEASAGAVILGVTFLGASSALKSWFIYQRFLPLCGSLNDVVD